MDEFIRISGSEILQNAGTISHKQAIEKAYTEYEKYKELTKNDLSQVEKHFMDSIEKSAKKLGHDKK